MTGVNRPESTGDLPSFGQLPGDFQQLLTSGLPACGPQLSAVKGTALLFPINVRYVYSVVKLDPDADQSAPEHEPPMGLEPITYRLRSDRSAN